MCSPGSVLVACRGAGEVGWERAYGPLVGRAVSRFSSLMLDRLLGRVHETEHGAPLLRGYLWWGLLLRAILLAALGTLLVVEGNVLAEWLLTARVPFVSQGDVEELTLISYSVTFGLLILGAGARWQLLRRLNANGQAGDPTPVEKPVPTED